MAGVKGMHTGGQNAKPAALKRLEGNPGRRKLPKEKKEKDAIPDGRLPKPPAHLSKLAQAEWKRLAPDLHMLGLLNRLDLNALGNHCETYARWREAIAQVQKVGMVVKSPSGYPIINPFHSIAQKCSAEMLNFMREFGMTPASRSRIETKRQKDDEEDKGSGWAGILN